ncbi:CPBP family glutamic-type intramembrane protease [Thermofilum pendens]|nr:CPBP family glutamic-type intramembrane protease [Thermofilum pendens]
MEGLWVAVYVGYVALVNVYPEAAYLELLACSFFLLRGNSALTGSRLDGRAAVFLLVAPVAFQPLLYVRSVTLPSPLSLLFAVLASFSEEYFFRGFLLGVAGNPLQAYLFALSHLALSDPVYLVNSALLVPHYFLLGLVAGLLAERWGLLSSILFHAAYNACSIFLYVEYSLQALLLLVLLDAALLVATFLLTTCKKSILTARVLPF